MVTRSETVVDGVENESGRRPGHSLLGARTVQAPAHLPNWSVQRSIRRSFSFPGRIWVPVVSAPPGAVWGLIPEERVMF